MGEPAFGDEVTDMLGQHMYSFARLLPSIGEQLIPVGPEMLLRLYSSPSGIWGGTWCFHVLLCYGAIIY